MCQCVDVGMCLLMNIHASLLVLYCIFTVPVQQLLSHHADRKKFEFLNFSVCSFSLIIILNFIIDNYIFIIMLH